MDDGYCWGPPAVLFPALAKFKNDIAKHVEAVHITHPGLVCDLCEKVLKTRDTLKSHMKSKHKDAQRLDE